MASLKRQIERWEKLKQPLITLLTCPLCSYNDSIQKYEKLDHPLTNKHFTIEIYKFLFIPYFIKKVC